MPTDNFSARRRAFRQLHESGCFVIPNPWNAGTARYLRALGYKALATTSSGFAFSIGLPDTDGAVSRDVALRHFADIVAATDLPVNADFQSGHAHLPEDVGQNVRLCVETGVAGLSIEDSSGDPQAPLYDLPLAVKRIRAARRAIDDSGSGVLLTGRAECYAVGHPDPLAESVRRLKAYADAGADVLFAPGVRTREQIEPVMKAAGSKPVNVLMSVNNGLTVSDLAAMGVRRISVGSALARAAWTGFLRAAKSIAQDGVFSGFDGSVTGVELNNFFREEWKKQQSGD
jgi:2-methylisocitrate lyase-like PEP mutase family enzyme